MTVNDVRRIERDGKVLLEMPEDYFWDLVTNAQSWTFRLTLSFPLNELDQLHALEGGVIEQLLSNEGQSIAIPPEATKEALVKENNTIDVARNTAFEEMRFPLQKPQKSE